jgi:hypothetical protein
MPPELVQISHKYFFSSSVFLPKNTRNFPFSIYLYLVIAVVVNVSIVPEVQAGQDGIHLRPPDAFGHQLVVAIRLPFPHHLPPGNAVVTIQEENSLSAPARKVET